MFIDWLSLYQDHPDKKLPLVGEEMAIYHDIETGELKKKVVHSLNKRGSFDSSIVVRCDGSRVSMSGNPSRWGQRDSLFGVKSVQEAVCVFNSVLDEFSLPHFTGNTLPQKLTDRQLQRNDSICRTGAVITRIDDATNYTTGSVQDALTLIEYLAGQRHQGNAGHVYPNGCTVDWKGRSKTGKGSRYSYFKYYAKWVEPGCSKSDKNYYDKLLNWCKEHGMIRHEITYKAMLLKKYGLDSIDAWDDEVIANMKEKYTMHNKTDHAVVAFSKISEEILKLGETPSISAKAQGLVDSWAAGNMYFMEDSMMSKSTRYRYRNLIKLVSGIDIYERINVVRLPMKIKTIELKEASPPKWYSRIAF